MLPTSVTRWSMNWVTVPAVACATAFRCAPFASSTDDTLSEVMYKPTKLSGTITTTSPSSSFCRETRISRPSSGMTGLLAAVRLGSAGTLDCPPHMGCHKSQFFDEMLCSKIRDVQVLIFVAGGEPLSPKRQSSHGKTQHQRLFLCASSRVQSIPCAGTERFFGKILPHTDS